MSKNLERLIYHVDVNSAFLSWTAVHRLNNGDKVDLRDIPAIIGGDEESRRGVVLAKSISAKSYGVITGESIFSARKKCPNLKVVKSSFDIYHGFSNSMVEILNEYTHKVQKYSIDECFLDVTELDRIKGSIDKEREALKLALEIKERIKRELGFTVNIGISENKLLAKMASDFKKPDKIHTLYKDEIRKKMWPLLVGELFMVGKRSVPRLNNLNIYTIGDLAQYDLGILKEKFKSKGVLMWKYANGIDDSEVQCDSGEVKGISNSTTFSSDIDNIKDANEILMYLGEKVYNRLQMNKKYCSSISVSIRSSNFRDYSHQRKLASPTNSKDAIIKTSLELFKERWEKEPIRLLGISLTGLTDRVEQQMSIFDVIKDRENAKKEKLDNAISNIRKKYGEDSVITLNNKRKKG